MVFNYDLKFALSKINGVLFSFNNQETAQTLPSKLKNYRSMMMVVAALLALTLVVFFADHLITFEDNWVSNIAVIIVSTAFVFPLAMIYFRNPDL